jgi:5,10-methylenetetrahydromethanopterin reductase
MEYGVDSTVTKGATALACRAEALGFDSVWFADSPAVAGDLFVGLGAVAAATERIRIGSGVCVPWSRNPVVTASGFGAVNALAPGRVDMTFGTGFSARRCFGLTAMKYQDFSVRVRAILDLLKGHPVIIATEEGPKAVRLMHPQAVNIEDDIDVYIAGSGPRIQGFAAEVGANILDHPTMLSLDLADSLRNIESRWSQVRGSRDGLRVSLTMSVVVLRDGETLDAPRVRAITGPLAMNPVQYWADEVMLRRRPLPASMSDIVRDAVDRYVALMRAQSNRDSIHTDIHTGHALFVRADASDILTSELINYVCIVGNSDHVRERISSLEEAGVKRIIIPVIPGNEDAMDDLAKVLQLSRR